MKAMVVSIGYVNPYRVAHYIYRDIYKNVHIHFIFWSMTDHYVVQTHIGSLHHIECCRRTLGDA